MKYCNTCGKQLEDDAKFCPYCGANQEESSSQTVVNEHKEASNQYSDKYRLVAGLLNIFLPFGIGRFYTGHTNIAIAQLIVCFCTCGIGGIWSFIDGIMMLCSEEMTDANGKKMKMN